MAADLLCQLDVDIMEAQDNLLAAKLSQASCANPHRSSDHSSSEGDLVMLSNLVEEGHYWQARLMSHLGRLARVGR